MICFLSKAQKYECFIDDEKQYILESFSDLAKQNPKYTVTSSDSAGMLTVKITGPETITCQFFFNYDSICEAASFIYCCNNCSEKHIREFLDDKYYGWFKKDGSTYYSKRRRKKTLIINKSDPSAVILTFTKANWSKQEYKIVTRRMRIAF